MSIQIYGIPTRELIRRLKRSYQRLLSPLTRLLNRYFGTRFYDYFLSKRQRVTTGKIDLGQNAAVYLIYPESGILASHFMALNYFLSKDFAPILVSNVRLSDGEKSKLAPLCYKIIERPNYGYDFGGYRDGILSICNRLSELDSLVMMNDSVWFPVSEDIDWIDQVKALEVDFAGASTDEGIPKRLPDDFENLDWTYTTDHPGFHYGSFAICVGKRILRDPDYYNFWKKYQITNSKALTIERGEKGFTQWAIAKGYKHDATANMDLLFAKIHQMDTSKTLKTISDLIILFEPERLELKRQLLLEYDGSVEWTEKAKTFILAAVANQGLSYTLPGFAVKELGYPFIKKSPVWLNSNSSGRMLRIARSLPSRTGEIIAAEVQDLRELNPPTF